MSGISEIVKRTDKRGGERGAAMVEFSVMMLAFVPLILLPMYFQDSLRFKLDAQEAVCSTVWDFAFANYETDTASSISGSIASSNQQVYANLWSGNKRDKPEKAGPWCDFAWENEISCTVDMGFAAGAYSVPLFGLAEDYHGAYTKGGLVTCQGNIAVENHYIPKQFNQNFAEKELFAHGTDPLSLPVEKLGILVDPWTIHDPSDAEEDGNGNDAFYERVDFLWKKPLTYQIFRGMWWIFVLKMMSKISLTAAAWDDPTSLKMSTQHYSGDSYKTRSVTVSGGRSNFYTNPFEDGENNEYQETFENRRAIYLGCQSFGDDCN